MNADKHLTGYDYVNESLLLSVGYSMGAEIEGKLVGFVLGHIRSGEFGVKGKVGWFTSTGED